MDMKIKILFLSRLLEIKEKQLLIEQEQSDLLRSILNLIRLESKK